MESALGMGPGLDRARGLGPLVLRPGTPGGECTLFIFWDYGVWAEEAALRWLPCVQRGPGQLPGRALSHRLDSLPPVGPEWGPGAWSP